jgi:hypothetical protein
VAVLVYNFYTALAAQTAIDTVKLTLNSLPLPHGTVEVRHYRVDSTHSNAYGVWLTQGKPTNPSAAQMTAMRTASNLVELNTMKTINYSGGADTESFTIPRQGLSLLVFKSTATSSVNENGKKLFNAPELSFSQGVISTNTSSGLSVSIFDLEGKLIKTFRTAQRSVNMNTLTGKRGVYLVRAQTEGARITTKFIRTE